MVAMSANRFMSGTSASGYRAMQTLRAGFPRERQFFVALPNSTASI